MPIKIRACLIVHLFVLLTGCAVLDTVEKHPVTASVVVRGLTYKAIENSADRSAAAIRIAKTASDAKVWLDFNSVTLADLAARTRMRIAQSDAELSDKLLFTTMVDMLEAELNRRIADGELDADAKMTVNKFLSWVAEAAAAYVHDTPPS